MKSNLPWGWFTPNDVAIYREIFSGIPKDGFAIELGCHRGRSLCSVADIIAERNITVMAVDTFQVMENDRDCTDPLGAFLENCREFGISDYVNIYKAKTIDVAQCFTNGKYHVVFIDADHDYEAVKLDIRFYAPKVRKDGILAGHDYHDWPGVTKAVNEKFGSKAQLSLGSSIWMVRG